LIRQKSATGDGPLTGASKEQLKKANAIRAANCVQNYNISPLSVLDMHNDQGTIELASKMTANLQRCMSYNDVGPA
jgi:hypothetical protein